jgi:cbb3-type cytochrome oxidase subunit 3
MQGGESEEEGDGDGGIDGVRYDMDSDEERELAEQIATSRFRLLYIAYRFHTLRAARKRNGNDDTFSPRPIWSRLLQSHVI